MKNFIIIALTASIIIGWISIAKAGSNDLDGYDIYLRNQNDADDIFRYQEPLFTADDLALEFNNGKNTGYNAASITIGQLSAELGATYQRISSLEKESYKNFECVMQEK